MASKFLSPVLMGNLKLITIPDELRKRASPYPISLESSNFGKLTAKTVYSKIINKEFLLANPELSKTSKAKIAKM